MMKEIAVSKKMYQCDSCDFTSNIKSSVAFHELEHTCNHSETVKNQHIFDNNAEYFDIETYCTKCRKTLSAVSGTLKEENRNAFLSELETLVKKYAKLDEEA